MKFIRAENWGGGLQRPEPPEEREVGLSTPPKPASLLYPGTVEGTQGWGVVAALLSLGCSARGTAW